MTRPEPFRRVERTEEDLLTIKETQAQHGEMLAEILRRLDTR